MIFQHTYDWIFGESPHTGAPKTATSRIVKPDHRLRTVLGTEMVLHKELRAFEECGGAKHKTDVPLYRVGTDYAVQPGRGKKAVGRVQITAIERYDVRTITAAQAHAEGFNSRWIFLKLWASMHDPAFYRDWVNMADDAAEAIIPVVIERRPANRYDAWLLTFEPVEVK